METGPDELETKAYLARHPILTQDYHCIGYELLYRNSNKNSYPLKVTDEQASLDLFLDNLSLYGLSPYVGEAMAFVNYSTAALMAELPGYLSAKQTIIEIVERTTPSKSLVEHVKILKQKGFRFALSDFDGKEKWLPLLPELDFIKFSATSGVDETIERFHMLKSCINANTKIIVEKVEDYNTYKQLKLSGVEYFQGYFFSKPMMVSHQTLSPSKQVLIQLLALCAKPDLDFITASKIVGQDVALTTRLLRMVNNVSPNVNTPINSLRQALVYLGELPFKKLISMFVLSELTVDKPSILCCQGLLRAKLCECIMKNYDTNKIFQAYLIGLLSILDAALDTDFENLILELNLDESFSEALLSKTGILGVILDLVLANERMDFSQVSIDFEVLGLSAKTFLICCEEAIRFVEQINN
ncbi:EAL and HDOD domain-containing protein [Pseudoalteromonas denitrificans]|nr:HDOD domain-containing protein [Pseudoalteromonas denitrificans]